MFAIRHALGWGLFFLAITPALAQSVDHTESHFGPFHEAPIASFDDVWSEPIPGTERGLSEIAQHPIDLMATEETVTPGKEDAAATTPVADSPELLSSRSPHPSVPRPQLLLPTDTITAAEAGLLEWFFGMLGIVGLIALGGVYWIYQVRPALDVRQTTGRLRLSSALSLPRRSGLFLVDVEDQAVLVAMEGGGIRHVVPLGRGASPKTTRRAAGGDKASLASSPSLSEGATASDEVVFHDVYQNGGPGGDICERSCQHPSPQQRPRLPLPIPTRPPETGTAHGCAVPDTTRTRSRRKHAAQH